MQQPLVSIIIPTYNRAKMIVKTLDSVFAQTYQNFEVIVVDDGSTDDTIQSLNEYKQSITRNDIVFKILTQENAGAPAARNHGLKNASGEYVVFFDSDDIMLLNRIKVQMGIMVKENSDCCACGFIINNDQIEYQPNLIKGKNALYSFISNILSGSTQSWIFKKNLILQIGGYDESLSCRQDFDIVFRVLLTNPRVSITNQVLSVFIDHDDEKRIMKTIKDNNKGYNSIIKYHSKIIEYCVRYEKRKLLFFSLINYSADIFLSFSSIQYLGLWREMASIVNRNKKYSIFNQLYTLIVTVAYLHYYYFKHILMSR
jgi:glycosyltransferase involved in cell wall biosynthesis